MYSLLRHCLTACPSVNHLAHSKGEVFAINSPFLALANQPSAANLPFLPPPNCLPYPSDLRASHRLSRCAQRKAKAGFAKQQTSCPARSLRPPLFAVLQLVQQPLAHSPVFLHFNVQLQEDLSAHDRLDLCPRERAHLF